MITNIKTKGFLGPDINQACYTKMVFTGPNRSGKTTRTNAIHLALNGFIATAHKVCKKPADILNQYASGDKLTSAIEINGVEFEFHVFRKESGTVSKRYRINKAKYSEKEYMEELVKAGNPKIIDLNSFVEFSDQKKIDSLFKLYPANVDINSLNAGIAKKEAAKNNYQAQIKTKNAVIKENTKAKSDIDLPAGTLAEVKADIERIETEYRECRDKLVAAKKEIEIKEREPEEISQHSADFDNENVIYDPEPPMPHNTIPDQALENKINTASRELNRDPITSLTKVLNAMKSAGCEICAAGMVCKMEIKKWGRND